jgi:hypothetical protein
MDNAGFTEFIFIGSGNKQAFRKPLLNWVNVSIKFGRNYREM